jgi:predicted transcriptional regulator
MTGEKDYLDFDPWAEDADTQIDRIVAEGGAQLAKLRAFIEEGLNSSAAPWEAAEAIKERVRRWRKEQSRLLDAALPEPGSPEEAGYIAAVERGMREAERLHTHEEVCAELDRIVTKGGRPLERLRTLIDDGENSGTAQPLDIEEVIEEGRKQRKARQNP